MGNRLLTACRTAPRLRTRPAVGRALTTVTAAGAVLAGLLGSTPQAQAATTVPSWLIPLHYSDDADGSHRACTGITLSKTRTLATPDCFTGRSHADMEWDHDLKSGLLRGGSSDPRYRSHPTYDAATRRGAVSVAIRATPASYGKPVMASPSDTALYATGAKATFYSWSGLDLDDAPRVRHTEQVVLKSAATCATLLGRTLPGGTLCTVPAPGAPPSRTRTSASATRAERSSAVASSSPYRPPGPPAVSRAGYVSTPGSPPTGPRSPTGPVTSTSTNGSAARSWRGNPATSLTSAPRTSRASWTVVTSTEWARCSTGTTISTS